jgi:hypothetical protein
MPGAPPMSAHVDLQGVSLFPSFTVRGVNWGQHLFARMPNLRWVSCASSIAGAQVEGLDLPSSRAGCGYVMVLLLVHSCWALSLLVTSL